MKRSSLSLLIVLAAVAVAVKDGYYDQDKYTYDIKHIELPVDHFSFTNTDTYRLRYLYSKQFYRKAGDPILFYAGNEGDVTLYAKSTGIMWEWAEKMNALVVFSEHRFYGKSLPYGKSQDPKHIGYLTTEQALADFALLVDHIRETTEGAKNSPVIAFGGSYGGMLATWMRMKYPHMILGSIASSAPIWQFVDMVKCDALPKVITATFKNSGVNCEENIRNSWKVFAEFGETDSGRAKLNKIFKTCTKIETVKHAQKLSGWVSGAYFNLAMFDYPYPVDYFEPLPAWPIKKACKHLKEADLEGEDLMKAVEKAITVYYNYEGTHKCLNMSQQAEPAVSDGFENWWFQACTEIIGPYCSGQGDDMLEYYAFNLTDTIAYCAETYKVTPRPYWMKTQYGGKNLRAASNIIFTNGDLDPWNAGGVLEKDKDLLPESVIQIMIKDAAHHLDLRGSHPADPAGLTSTRDRMFRITQDWISDYESKQKPVEECPLIYSFIDLLSSKGGLLALSTILAIILFALGRCFC